MPAVISSQLNALGEVLLGPVPDASALLIVKVASQLMAIGATTFTVTAVPLLVAEVLSAHADVLRANALTARTKNDERTQVFILSPSEGFNLSY